MHCLQHSDFTRSHTAVALGKPSLFSLRQHQTVLDFRTSRTAKRIQSRGSAIAGYYGPVSEIDTAFTFQFRYLLVSS